MSLNRNQKRALKALMRAPSVAAAARGCGLAERTLWRYLGDDDFTAALDERLDKETKVLGASLAGMSDEAIKTLSGLMTDENTSPSVRARCAVAWLKQRRDAIELDQLQKRVQRLEKLLDEQVP